MLIKDKKGQGFQFSSLVIGLIIFGAIIVGMGQGYIVETARYYNVSDATLDFNDFDIAKNVTKTGTNLSNDTLNPGTISGTDSIIDAIFGGSVSAVLGFIGNTFAITGKLLKTAGSQFGVPTWFIGAVITIIMVSLVFLLVSAVFKFRI